jgi:hypothetical protein
MLAAAASRARHLDRVLTRQQRLAGDIGDDCARWASGVAVLWPSHSEICTSECSLSWIRRLAKL